MKDELDPEIEDIAYHRDYSRKDSLEDEDEKEEEGQNKGIDMNDLANELEGY